jgi:hypothetical protein
VFPAHAGRSTVDEQYCPRHGWTQGGFAMYIQTTQGVDGHRGVCHVNSDWQKQQASWTGPDEFPAKRMLLVCDNASVHKVDEIKKLMDQYGIILRFLPPKNGSRSNNVSKVKHCLTRDPILRLPHGFLPNQPCCKGSFSIRRPTWRSCILKKQRT